MSCFLLFLSIQAIADSQQSNVITKIDSRAKISIGYDDNVSDLVADSIKSRFVQLYINSDVNTFLSSRTILSLKIQDGLKYHDAKSLSNESILINKMGFSLSHNIQDHFLPELSGEIRSRTSIHSKSYVSPSEESYLRGNTGLAIKTIFSSDLSAKVSYNYKAINFDDFDPFDRRGNELGFRADLKLLPNSFLNVQYSKEITKFNKWNEGTAPRKDKTDATSIGLQLYKKVLLNLSASYESNKSNVTGYDYKGYMLSALMAKTISDNTVIELYTLYRSRDHDSSETDSNSTQIDIEDEERNIVLIKVSRDITKHSALEIQYDLRRNRSGIEEGTYTKNIFSASIISDF